MSKIVKPFVNMLELFRQSCRRFFLCGSYVANKLLESGDREQLMKLIGRIQGCISAQLARQSTVLAIVNPSIRPSVCHTPSLCQNSSCYNRAVFTGGQPHDSSFLVVNFTAKLQLCHWLLAWDQIRRQKMTVIHEHTSGIICYVT